MMEQSLPPYEMLPQGTSRDEVSRSTTVLIEEERPPPRDHLAWSLFTTLYCNVFCLGLLATVFSIKSRDRKVLHDHSGALSYGTTAKCLNILALVINIVLTITIIIIIVSVVG